MTFGREFVAQTVPEWQEAYVNYSHLKKLLKDLRTHKQTGRPPMEASLSRQISRYRAFSGLIIHRHETKHVDDHEDIESQVIHVRPVKKEGSESFRYQTTLMPDGGENEEREETFFGVLDSEFNKVEKFYESKVNEALLEAEELNKQMDALIAFRIQVEKPHGVFDKEAETNNQISRSGMIQNHMDAIDEDSSFHVGREKERESGDEEIGEEETKESCVQEMRTPPMEILSNVKLQDHLETPLSTIKGFLKVPKDTELSFTTKTLKKVEDNLKKAFVHFYNKLSLLKNYSFLNISAISRIMKKYDKITSTNASKAYMKMVDNSFLGGSEEVTKLMERVETTFIKHFANSHSSKAMRILRPKAKREKHKVTFSTGFFAGCAAALVFALVLIIHVRNIVNQPGTTKYMETLFPLYSLYLFIVLHMLMYGGSIFYWRKYRVNYSFIFGFKQGSELGYREVFLLSFGLAVAALASVLANLDMDMNPTLDYTEFLPLCLLVIVITILLCPLNIIYRSSRFFFIKTLFRALLAPFFKVTLPDFILADQLCSQVQAFRSLEFYICYYGWGGYKNRNNTCSTSNVFNIFYFIVAGLPFWLRFCQCMRRLVEEKDGLQAWNASKYFLTIVAVCARTAYNFNKDSVSWKVVAWVLLVGVGIFVAYWDLVYDWGVLNRKSKNPWLRDKLLVPYKSIYYAAMVMNVFLRLAWVETVLDFNGFSLHSQAYSTIVASLEIFRRGVWNFFRLENEHLTNIGKFRAFKSVPLPFNYEDREDEDEDDDKNDR